MSKGQKSIPNIGNKKTTTLKVFEWERNSPQGLQLPECIACTRSTIRIRLCHVSAREKGLVCIAAMSVQVVAGKMAEVELKDVPTKDLSPISPKSVEKEGIKTEPGSAVSAAASPTAEPSPNPTKMPQASAMKRPDQQQNGGEAFVNQDGTVAEAPRMKKVMGWFCSEMCYLCCLT